MARNGYRSPLSLEVLHERQASTANDLSQLAENTSRQIRDLATSTSQQIAGVSSQIEGIKSTITERSRVPWQALGVMLAALGLIGALVYWPIREGQTRVETAIDRMITNVEGNVRRADDRFLTKAEYGSLNTAASQRRDDLNRLIEQRITRLEADTGSIEKGIVPRPEHEEKWRSADLRFADQQRQIDAIRTSFSDLYSPKDALKSMQARIDDLERRLRSGPAN